MLAPADGFYHTPGLGKDEVRIAYVLKISDLKKAMETLAVALKEYRAQKKHNGLFFYLCSKIKLSFLDNKI